MKNKKLGIRLFINIILFSLLLILIIFILKKNKIGFENKQFICLYCQIKNESMNLDVFIRHYLWQGVDKIYIVDNDSNDNPLKILLPYIYENKVQYIFRDEKAQFLNILKDNIEKEKLKEKYEWIIVCDADEFYYGYPEILKEQLKTYECDAIYTNWRMFGSDSLIEHPPDIRTAITHREKNVAHLTKYIFNTKNIDINDLSVHDIHNDPHKYKIIIENDKIRLNHYAIQSLNYFQNVKMTRGDSANLINIRDMNYFNKYDYDEYEDNDLKHLILNNQ